MSLMQSAQAAILKPEVIALARQLSEHGLGVCVPHEHGPDEEFLPLTANRVQLESARTVQFVDHDSPALASTVPTGWRWNGTSVDVIAACKVPHY